MINHWWVTRPKRKLTAIPEIVALFAETALNAEWTGQRNAHLEVEKALEREGLKRKGTRRDQTGGGARTYLSWLESLGLVFRQEGTGQLRLTLAGEELLNGGSPVAILKEQVLKYQFPSSYSLSRNVDVHERFKIRPFRFLLRLLQAPEIGYLTEEEIAKIVLVSAENETAGCFRKVLEKILTFRAFGDSQLEANFLEIYGPSKGSGNQKRPYGHLQDTANTFVNWLEYTQLIRRSEGRIEIAPECASEVSKIISASPPFIDRPDQPEYFQRKFGLPPGKQKDLRDLLKSTTITARLVEENKVRRHFLAIASTKPIYRIGSEIISLVSDKSGVDKHATEDILLRQFPLGAMGSFYSEFYHMAFAGRENAREFELATVEIMRDVFGYRSEHVGPLGKTPDVLVLSNSDGYAGIFDNKAYSSYAMNNDHRNRMVYNYIPKYRVVDGKPLAFFSYIAGGFATSIEDSIRSVTEETSVEGSAVPVSSFLRLVERHIENAYTHEELRNKFSSGRTLNLGSV